MTHAELQDIATGHGLKVIISPDLEPALTGYIWDKALDGSDTIRAVYDPDKTLVRKGMTDEAVNEWFYFIRDTDETDRKHPIFIYTHHNKEEQL